MIPQVKQIADRVQFMRDSLDLTEESVAAAIGVSLETYREYESGTNDIPISKLYAIAEALDVDPTLLLSGDAPKMDDYTIVRGGRGVKVERRAGYSFVSLAYNYVGRQYEPMIVDLDPKSEVPPLVTHGGQEFNLVLSGVVAVNIGGREHILNAGDSVFFNPTIPHGQRALGDEHARFLTIINE